MTYFNLDQAEVVELKAAEMTEVDGGGRIGTILCIIGAVCNFFGV
ncbi:hypothetical protein [Spirosoma flavum]|uniref:Class IIb bacteriocin, lactobin A/cerein 7B family n=1 Tax=Spirosoma flavum TaxID=2048557 RepID=A0ABW6AI58_9BACT